MVKDSNKIPDPEFERLGLKGWKRFKEEFVDIRKDYRWYGEIALQLRLGKSIEIYKDAFFCMDFLEALHKIWTDRYHYVVNNFEELILFYEGDYKQYIPWDCLLEDAGPCNSDVPRGKDFVIALSRPFFNSIVEDAKKSNNKLLLLKGNKAYELTVKEKEHYTDSLLFNKIEMKKVDVIEV